MANKRGEKQTWLNDDDAANGSAAPAASRRAVGSTNKELLTRELASLKLQANTAQKERITASVGMWSVMTPAELLTKPINVAKKFATDHKGKSKHNFGSPHIQVWMSVLKNSVIHTEAKLLLNQHTHDEKIFEKALDRVKKEIEMFERKGPENEHKHQMAQMAMHVILDFLGGDVLPSMPTTELERQCQRNIDDVQKALLGPDNLPWNMC